MAPNGTASRKSKQNLLHSTHLNSISPVRSPLIMGSAPAASVPKKPAKANARTSIPLENLFDDMKDVSSPSSALGASEDLKKALSSVKKAGTWDSEGTLLVISDRYII